MYLGGLGKDPSGEICVTDLIQHGVDTSKIQFFDDDATAHSVILMTPWGRDRSILAYKGTNDLFSKEHVLKRRFKIVAVLLGLV